MGTFEKPLGLENRLEPRPSGDFLTPWRRASQLTTCFLYWAPVRSFPVPLEQREWFTTFLIRWGEACRKQLKLSAEPFLQVKVIQPALGDAFVSRSMDLNPIFGLSRKPVSAMPALPTPQDVERMQRGEKKFSFNDYVADYCYWFLNNKEEKILPFFGHGGLTLIYRKAGPAPELPKVTLPKPMQEHPFFKSIDIQEKMISASRLSDPFLGKSKELFGAGLETSTQYPGLLFIIPLLASSDFFQQPAEERKKWFDLCEIYINESPSDQGILLATKTDLEKELSEVLHTMRAEGREYPR